MSHLANVTWKHRIRIWINRKHAAVCWEMDQRRVLAVRVLLERIFTGQKAADHRRLIRKLTRCRRNVILPSSQSELKIFVYMLFVLSNNDDSYFLKSIRKSQPKHDTRQWNLINLRSRRAQWNRQTERFGYQERSENNWSKKYWLKQFTYKSWNFFRLVPKTWG